MLRNSKNTKKGPSAKELQSTAAISRETGSGQIDAAPAPEQTVVPSLAVVPGNAQPPAPSDHVVELPTPAVTVSNKARVKAKAKDNLDPDEKKLLETYERQVRDGIAAFIIVGHALKEIRDGRLYRGDYNTFSGYCFDRWRVQRAHAYRIIDAAALAAKLSPPGDKTAPQSEAQLRPLIGLPIDQAQSVWAKAIEMADGKSPTPTIVKKALAKHRGVKPAPAPTEKFPKVVDGGGSKQGILRA